MSTTFTTTSRRRSSTPQAAARSRAQTPGNDVFSRLNALASAAPQVHGTLLGPFAHGDNWFHLPRYLFLGENALEEPWRIALYGGFDGADDRATRAVAHTLERIALEPRLGDAFNLAFYPLVNPSGAMDGTTATRAGHHLANENWPNSTAPEIVWLARDARALQFHGAIVVRTSAETEEFTGWLRGFSPGEPFLHAEPVRGKSKAGYLPFTFPIQWEPHPQGFDAATGPLTLAADFRARPFEITLNLPAALSPEWAVQAVGNTVRVFLNNFRTAAATGMHI